MGANNSKLILSINITNYLTSNEYVRKSITEQEFNEYKDFIAAIQKRIQSCSNSWNWKNRLPERWIQNENRYEYDMFAINSFLSENGYADYISAESFIKFFRKFTPAGGDGISNIKVLKVIETEIIL